MNKTVNINLGNRAFTIDDDAYELLGQYLETIKHVYRNQPDAEELAKDIESAQQNCWNRNSRQATP